MTLDVSDNRSEDKKEEISYRTKDYHLSISDDDTFLLTATYDNRVVPLLSFDAKEDQIVVMIGRHMRLESYYVNFRGVRDRELGVYKFNTRVLPIDNLRKHQKEDLNEFISP